MPLTVADIQHSLAEACNKSALHWREISVSEIDRNLPLAIFAYNCALDNERIAEEEKQFGNQN